MATTRGLESAIFLYMDGLYAMSNVVDYYIAYCEERGLECRKEWFMSSLADIYVEYEKTEAYFKMKGRVYGLLDDVLDGKFLSCNVR